MKLRQAMALLSAIVLGSFVSQLPVQAEDHKAELVQLIRQEDGALSALAVEKLVTLNLSPEWWHYLLQRDNQSYHTISNMANSLLEVGKTLGYGDVAVLDETHDATSPLVADAMAKLQGKVSFALQLTDPAKDDAARKRVVDNVSMFEAPMTNDYYCKPRGRQLHLFLSQDAKAAAMRVQVSKDGNDYHFAVPTYVDLMTSPIQAGFKQGT